MSLQKRVFTPTNQILNAEQQQHSASQTYSKTNCPAVTSTGENFPSLLFLLFPESVAAVAVRLGKVWERECCCCSAIQNLILLPRFCNDITNKRTNEKTSKKYILKLWASQLASKSSHYFVISWAVPKNHSSRVRTYNA